MKTIQQLMQAVLKNYGDMEIWRYRVMDASERFGEHKRNIRGA